MRIAVDGPVRDADGYSSATRGIIVGLARIGADVVSDLNWGSCPGWLEPEVEEAVSKGFGGADFGIRLSQPDSGYLAPGKVKICFSMWEFTRIPMCSLRGDPQKGRPLTRVISWPEGINRVSANFVPSQHSRQLWLDAGCNTPLFVVPLGYDDRVYKPRTRTEDRPFTFICAGTLSGRKNPLLLLRCFREVFDDSPEVRLVFKTASHLPLVWKDPLPDNVTVINENWPHEKIADLYAEADCFISTSQGEGFGLPLVESMATGLPVIVTGWSAPVDFVTSKVGWLLDYDLQVVGTDWYYDEYTYQKIGYAQPREQSVKDAMIHAFEHRDEVKAKGEAAADWVKDNYTWEHTARKIVKILEGFNG